ALADGLARATAAAAAKLGPDKAAPLVAAQKAAQGATPDTQEQELSAWVDACLSALGDDADSVAWTCRPLRDALDAIDAGTAQAQAAPGAYKAQMAAGLGACRDALATARANGQSACVAAYQKSPPAPALPRPPWLPQAEAVSIDYT